ncbi:hypothetical protein HQ587_11120 [bacterium]|nr:hypothetical protein [bacterium]
MGLFSNMLQPRRFRFQPRYYKSDDDKKISFRRITRYDPHERSSAPWFYLAVLIAVGILIIILGGIRGPARPPALTVDDVAGITIELETE